MDLALNNLLRLIFYKTLPTNQQTKQHYTAKKKKKKESLVSHLV